jgi:YggT family protein
MSCALSDLISIYILVLFARAILSFLPISPDSGLYRVQQVLGRLTEPILAPMRRFIPPLGMFDMSFLVLFILLSVVRANLHCSHTILGGL